MLSWMKYKLGQGCLEKYQYNQICRRQHPYGRKQRRTKKPLDEWQRGEWKSQLKTQHSKKLWSWHLVPSVQFSHSVVSWSLWPYGLQHTKPPCPSPTTGAYSNSCPLSQWCHQTISSSAIPFSFTFNLSQHQGLFLRVSSSHQVAKVFEFQLQHYLLQWRIRTDSFKMDWFYLLAVQGTLKSLLQHHSSKTAILQHSAFFIVQLSHPYMTTGKNSID